MSKIEVNQISSQCGSTLTIGQSGDTVTLACGASQTGFGRTGTVNWDTTAKTAGFTAVSGNGYFVNTTSGAITVTLPATPSSGDIVSISDYAGTSISNNITIARNGSNINGEASDLTIVANNSAVTLIYVDGTEGWKTTSTSNTNNLNTDPAYVAATGGTVTCCGDYKIHTFTGPGTFTVTCAGNALGSNSVDYLIIAGGGGGGRSTGGGGGAGGYRESSGTASGCYTASPLGACVSALPVTATGYPITVGGGGAAGTSPVNDGVPGSNSIFSTITSNGGGGGGGEIDDRAGLAGGSGGGGSIGGGVVGPAGSGNTPPTSPPQGNNGGNAGPGVPVRMAGGGGGSTGLGVDGTGPGTGGNGGAGATSSINTSSVTRASGGGGGGGGGATPAPATPGGGGTGGVGSPTGPNGTAGTANTGGGGGGGADNTDGSAGGSGIVIIRYKYQ